MKERPILFSAAMVRALLDGTKTQTRRVVKMPPNVVRRGVDPRYADHMAGRYSRGSGQYIGGNPDFTGDQPPALHITCLDKTCQSVVCPYGVPGCRLWVKETITFNAWWDDGVVEVLYPANNERRSMRALVDDYGVWLEMRGRHMLRSGAVVDENDALHMPDGVPVPSTPSIHMPRWASRITLEITDVRCERLQDISKEDVRAEGFVNETSDDCDAMTAALQRERAWGYRALWNSINGDGAWAANPFVWAISFTRVTP